MSFKKSGISIDCAQCQCIDKGEHGNFTVTVPLADNETSLRGVARLHCSISPQNHQVAMIDWLDADAKPIEAPQALQQRLRDLLGFIEHQRICGNTRICPEEVNRIVQASEQPEK